MAGNGNHTSIDPDAVRAAAGQIGGLLGDMSPFHRCASIKTKAGNFETAAWLEELVHGRQANLLQHATHVKLVLNEINQSLIQISDMLQMTDDENAQHLGRSLSHEVNLLRLNSFNNGAKG